MAFEEKRKNVEEKEKIRCWWRMHSFRP